MSCSRSWSWETRQESQITFINFSNLPLPHSGKYRKVDGFHSFRFRLMTPRIDDVKWMEWLGGSMWFFSLDRKSEEEARQTQNEKSQCSRASHYKTLKHLWNVLPAKFSVSFHFLRSVKFSKPTISSSALFSFARYHQSFLILKSARVREKFNEILISFDFPHLAGCEISKPSFGSNSTWLQSEETGIAVNFRLFFCKSK